jgi:hypothetical protein
MNPEKRSNLVSGFRVPLRGPGMTCRRMVLTSWSNVEQAPPVAFNDTPPPVIPAKAGIQQRCMEQRDYRQSSARKRLVRKLMANLYPFGPPLRSKVLFPFSRRKPA